MSGVSSACDEMQQVAQMLMKRVDTMRMPGLSFCPGFRSSHSAVGDTVCACAVASAPPAVQDRFTPEPPHLPQRTAELLQQAPAQRAQQRGVRSSIDTEAPI